MSWVTDQSSRRHHNQYGRGAHLGYLDLARLLFTTRHLYRPNISNQLNDYLNIFSTPEKSSWRGKAVFLRQLLRGQSLFASPESIFVGIRGRRQNEHFDFHHFKIFRVMSSIEL